MSLATGEEKSVRNSLSNLILRLFYSVLMKNVLLFFWRPHDSASYVQSDFERLLKEFCTYGINLILGLFYSGSDEKRTQFSEVVHFAASIIQSDSESLPKEFCRYGSNSILRVFYSGSDEKRTVNFLFIFLPHMFRLILRVSNQNCVGVV